MIQQHEPTRTGFLVVDTESIPDGELLRSVKYPGEQLTAESAICKAQDEAREASKTNSDFLPVSFHIPIAVCVVRAGIDFRLQQITCLDAPNFVSREIVRKFWFGLETYKKAKLVTFNGRGFDMPLMELAAFRHGFSCKDFYLNRNRFNGPIDLLDWITNFGGCRLAGGLNLLAKMIGKPGKLGVSGDQVYDMWKAGKIREINDYCMFDTLDTYFVFLRTRVMTGDIDLEKEQELINDAREFLANRAQELPVLNEYLASWSDQPEVV